MEKRFDTRCSHSKAVFNALRKERRAQYQKGLYACVQVEFSFNSNRIEGSGLSKTQVGWIYGNRIVPPEEDTIWVDDILEAVNHFICVDNLIDKAHRPLSEKFIKNLHAILKSNTFDSRKAPKSLVCDRGLQIGAQYGWRGRDYRPGKRRYRDEESHQRIRKQE